jgi:hypothetical protein
VSSSRLGLCQLGGGAASLRSNSVHILSSVYRQQLVHQVGQMGSC